MPPYRRFLALALLALLTPAAVSHGGDEDSSDADDVPVVGRPSDLPFSGASGQFQVSARAAPTTLEAETPLTLTVRVIATGPVRHAPERPDLNALPPFAERFYIEAPDAGGTRHPDAKTWEFVYRLKPRWTSVSEVPSLPFVYFNPAIRPASKGFQVIYTDPIPLRVTPRAVVPVPLKAPEAAFQLTGTPADWISRQTRWQPPGPFGAGLLLLLPPLLCAAWYAGWRHLYPDAARRARQRRSRAARHALHALRGSRRQSGAERAAQVAAAVARYLRERFDLAAEEPTPAEAAEHLHRCGCSPALSDQAARLFQTCDAARFLPSPDGKAVNLPEEATQLILAVEAETCSPAHS